MSEIVDGRAQRSIETRRALEQAAITLFLDRGYDRTTIDDIANRAGVSARTFFRHFDAKEDVLIGDQGQMRLRLALCFAERPDDEPLLTCVREALIAFAGLYEDERADHLRRARLSWNVPSVAARSAELRRPWEELITDLCARRLGVDARLDLRPLLIARATLAALETALQWWMLHDGRPPLPALIASTLDLLQTGFGADA